MAILPSNTFMFNYNAKQYDPTTHSFPKAKGQLLDEDLVLNGTPPSYGEDYVNTGSLYMGKTYSSNSDNPFNRNSSNKTFTFICKTSGFTGGSTNIFANRGNNYNYMVRGNMFHTSSSGYLSLNPPSHPQICVIRINSDGSSVRRFVDSNGNTLASVSASSISWGSETNGFAFFAGYSSGGELFAATFYWMYCSLEALTDEQILQVISYNEGNMLSFGTDPETLTFNANEGTETVTLMSESPWTATTNDSWITLSDYTGETGQTLSVSVSYNSFNERTGVVTFTDGENTATLTVTQEANTLAPIMKIYRNGRRIN